MGRANKKDGAWHHDDAAPNYDESIFILIDNKYDPLPTPVLARAVLRKVESKLLDSEFIILDAGRVGGLLELGTNGGLVQQYDVIAWRYAGEPGENPKRAFAEIAV